MHKIEDIFPDFRFIKEEEKTDRFYELLAITAAIKDERTDKTNLTSTEKNYIQNITSQDVLHMNKELELFNPMSEKCILMDPKYMDMAMSPIAMMGMNLGNEMNPQERFSQIKENTIGNMKENPIFFEGFKEYANLFIKTQEYAGARYAAYIDNDYGKKTPEQQNKIKEIWKNRPLEVIALSVIAEKNLENQLTSRIKNADDLQAKLDNIPQVTELAQQLTVADIKESTEKAKTEARPNYELSQVPNDGKSSVKVATGRYA